MIQKWFDEAVDYGLQVFNINGVQCIFYKGFKMSLVNNKYIIEDVRKNDFYTDVEENHFEILKTNGFIQGADNISYERNNSRVTKFTKTLEKLYTDKEKMVKSKKSNTQKFENLINGIYKYIDLLFFYKAKVLQHQNKYKIPVV